jgi:Septin
VTPDGREIRGRSYPWGVIEVDNEEHCDFVKLRQMLVRTYMEELREYTNDVLYENWRTEKLVSMGVVQDSSVFKEVKYGPLILCVSSVSYVSCDSPALRMQEERVLHEAKLAKMEAEMKMVFRQKVQEKEAKLKQSEEELYARHQEMKDSLEKQRLDLEEKKRKIENGRPLTPEKGTVRDGLLFLLLPRVTRIVLAAETKEGFPPCLNCQSVYFIFPFTGKNTQSSMPSIFMACLLLTAPPCLTLVSYAPLSLPRLLCFNFGAISTRHTRLHGYPRHVLPQLPLYEYHLPPRLVLVFAGTSVKHCR